jgi:uncharacterized protein
MMIMNKQTDKDKKKPLCRWIRILFITLGIFSLCLGLIGIFIPILPTTPFVLLSAALFARSSDWFYRLLIENRLFGRYIRDYRQGKGVPIKVKTGAIIILWITIGLSIYFAVEMLWLRILLAAVAAGVTLHIASIRKKD